MLLLTDVRAAFRDFATAEANAINKITTPEAARLTLPDGSMRPKVEAAIDLMRAGAGFAAIARLEDALEVLQGRAGTRIDADDRL